MTIKPVICVSNLSKAFNIYRRPIDLLYEIVGGKSRHEVFWALRDINLQIYEGDRVGIIGPNGAGKSTLLQIINGTLSPTSGRVAINGRISSMLSLTSFLNGQETGAENIRYNLEIMGAPIKDIARLSEEIIDFTELGSFIDAPVSTYSSGMNARLAFAISTAIAPEILLVDEVLSVGDGYFVGKATKRMMDLCAHGRALLYVSHSLSALQMLCTKAVWLDKGTIRMVGSVPHVAKLYEEDYRRREDETLREQGRRRLSALAGAASPDDLCQASFWRLRIVAKGGEPFHATHYVSRVAINGNELGVGDCVGSKDDEKVANLDVLDSEWGHLYERQGRECRVLSAATGRKRGGHILLRKSSDNADSQRNDGVPVTVEVTLASPTGSDDLSVEYLDESTGEWAALASATDTQQNACDDADWRLLKYIGRLPIVSDSARAAAREYLVRRHMSDVVVRNATVIVGGQESRVIEERQPFQINIEAEVIRSVPSLDFGLRIIRSDGVYMFWQSTGQSSGNISAEPGRLIVEFDFDPNLFPGGDYHVSVGAANGWNIDNNYPHSEVFDRNINMTDFVIRREFPRLDLGAINQRVRTRINAIPSSNGGKTKKP